RPKMYSILVDDGTGKLTGSKKAKGIKKSVIKKYITHDDFKKVLMETGRTFARMKMLRSSSHEIRSIEVQKVGLFCYDNKRYILNNVQTLAHGYKGFHPFENPGDTCDPQDKVESLPLNINNIIKNYSIDIYRLLKWLSRVPEEIVQQAIKKQ